MTREWPAKDSHVHPRAGADPGGGAHAGSGAHAGGVDHAGGGADRGGGADSGFVGTLDPDPGADHEPDAEAVPHPDAALVVTADPRIRDHAARLAAVAGCALRITGAVAEAEWLTARIVLVGADAAAGCVRSGLPRRGRVMLLCAQPAEPPLWKTAVAIGAEQVFELPAREEEILTELATVATGPATPPSAVVALVSGCGGAGASTLAAAVAVRAARRGRHPMLIDLDPFGGGADLLLGAEDAPGSRWPQLRGATGRFPPEALRAALPEAAGVRVLSGGRSGPLQPPEPAVRAVLTAARRCADPVVVDVSRTFGPAAHAALLAADRVWVVVTNEVRSVAAAAQVLRWCRQRGVPPRLAVRIVRVGGITAVEIGAALATPVAVGFRGSRGVRVGLDLGDPRGLRRRPLRRAAARLLDDAEGDAA